MDFNKEKCPYKTVCKYYNIASECNSGCTRYIEIMSLLETSNIPEFWWQAKKLIPEKQDLETFKKLNTFKENILENISLGKNLLIYSDKVGNGKTSWTIKIMLSYFNNIWIGNGLKPRGSFVNVPQFIIENKDNITLRDNVIIESKQFYKDIDLLILDDIGSVNKTEYNIEQLLNIVDYRVLAGKTTLYTSNIPPKDLPTVLGKRLASRVLANVEVLEIKGGDNR